MKPAAIGRDLLGLLSVVDRMERLLLGVLVTVNLALPILLVLVAWPRPWRAFDGETTPINWFSSVQCALIAALALSVYGMTVLGQRAGTEPIKRAWPWALFCLGFLAMSLDEQFQGHERIREEFLKPRGLFTDIGLIMPGDVVLIFYVLSGLALSYFLVQEVRQSRTSLIAFLAAIALIGVSAVQDSLDLESYISRPVRHFQIIAEEVAEIWAQLLFAVAFVTLLFRKLRLFLRGLLPP